MLSYFADPGNSLLLFAFGSFVTALAIICTGLIARYKTGPIEEKKFRSCFGDLDILIRWIVLPSLAFSAVSETAQLFRMDPSKLRVDETAIGMLFLAAVVLAISEPILGFLILKFFVSPVSSAAAVSSASAAPTPSTPSEQQPTAQAAQVVEMMDVDQQPAVESSPPTAVVSPPAAAGATANVPPPQQQTAAAQPSFLRDFACICLSSSPVAFPLVFVTAIFMLQLQEELTLDHQLSQFGKHNSSAAATAASSNFSGTNSASKQSVIFYDFQLSKAIIVILIVLRLALERSLLLFCDTRDIAGTVLFVHLPSSPLLKPFSDNVLTCVVLVLALICSAAGVMESGSDGAPKTSSDRTVLEAVIAFFVGTTSTIADLTCALTITVESLEMVSSTVWPRPQVQQQQQPQSQHQRDKDSAEDSQQEKNGKSRDGESSDICDFADQISVNSIFFTQVLLRLFFLLVCLKAFGQLPSAGAPPSHLFALVLFSLSPGTVYPGNCDLVEQHFSSPRQGKDFRQFQARIAMRSAVVAVLLTPILCSQLQKY